jgi:GxxExxY protein
MNADERGGSTEPMLLNLLTERVIGCAIRVSNQLGCGFLEKVYENALAHELRKAGHVVQQQHPISVLYDNVVVGDYLVDILVDGRLILELKAVKAIDEIHVAQTINYLRASVHSVGLILNFGKPKLQIKRLVHQF